MHFHNTLDLVKIDNFIWIRVTIIVPVFDLGTVFSG